MVNKKITLRAARINSNLTQEKAAKILGVSRATLGNWEKGKTFPKIENIKNIEECYGLEYKDIIFLNLYNALNVN